MCGVIRCLRVCATGQLQAFGQGNQPDEAGTSSRYLSIALALCERMSVTLRLILSLFSYIASDIVTVQLIIIKLCRSKLGAFRVGHQQWWALEVFRLEYNENCSFIIF